MRKRWLGAKVAADSSDLLKHTLGRLLARAPSTPTVGRSRAEKSALSDANTDASWTACLNRGDDLPPCRLSVLIASGSRSAIRLEPYGGSDSAARTKI
jgi:hypothetical protein